MCGERLNRVRGAEELCVRLERSLEEAAVSISLLIKSRSFVETFIPRSAGVPRTCRILPQKERRNCK